MFTRASSAASSAAEELPDGRDHLVHFDSRVARRERQGQDFADEAFRARERWRIEGLDRRLLVARHGVAGAGGPEGIA